MNEPGLRIFATALALLAAGLSVWVLALRRGLRESERLRHEAQRKQEHAQRQQEEAQRAASVGQLTAGFAHEMKNSLMVVLGFAELARAVAERPAAAGGLGSLHPDPKILHHLVDVETEARKSVAQLQALLAYASGAPAARAPHGANELVQEALAMVRPLARMRGLQLEETRGEAGAIACDPFAIRQLLLNLLLNALAFAASRITVSTAPGADGRIEIAIGNDGPAIPEQERARIFERFVTTRPGGSGLGLAVSREIAEAHGGTLSLREGADTEFVVSLPRASAE